jgi:hypothetical protein
MASNINANNINGAYPVPGVDNDSQGFRNNFTSIKNNFVAAKLEIEDLQNKVVLKSALAGTSLNNDMTGAPLSAAEIKDFRETEVDLGTTQGSIILDHAQGHYYKVISFDSLSLGFSNLPPSGSVGRIRLVLKLSNITHTLTLPNTVTLGLAGILNYNPATRAISFDAIGTYIFEFVTDDNGATIHIQDLTRGSTLAAGLRYTLPAATANALGGVKIGTGLAIDSQGVISFDGPNIAAAPGGSIRSVQFNNGSSGFGGSSNFTFNAANNVLTVGGNIYAAGNGIGVFGGDNLNGLVLNINGSSQPVSTWQVDTDAKLGYNRTIDQFSFTPNGHVDTMTLSYNALTIGSAVVPYANQTSWSVPSDIKLKTNIKAVDANKSLDIVNSLNPVDFQMIATGQDSKGFIAQEIEEIYPESVSEYVGNDNETYKTLAFNADFFADIVAALQALTARIEVIEKQLAQR